MKDKDFNKKGIIWTIIILLIIVIYLYWSYNSYKAKISNENINNIEQIDNTQNNSTSTNSTTTNNKDNNLQNNNTNKNTMTTNNTKDIALLKTNYGNIEIALNRENAPKAVDNFIKLAKSGFYDGVRFHRVIKGFMIQTGDPQSKDLSKKSQWGNGDPGYKFADELTGKEKYEIGTVAMANSGPNTNGSQFFIMTSNTTLQPAYTIFGKVILGQDVAMKIQEVETEGKGIVDRPITDVIVESVSVK